MLYNRDFQITFTFQDMKELQERDILLEYIRNNYEKKCFKNCFIDKILEINHHGDYKILNNFNSDIIVDVNFKAIISKYEKFEIITDLEITEINNNVILCKKEHIMAYIKMDDKLKDIYNKGQLIPAIIGSSKYKLNSSIISINAYPFVPKYEDQKYYMITKLTKVEEEQLNNTIIKQIKEEYEKLKIVSNNKTILEYFEKLLYPYKTIKKSDNTIILKDLFKLSLNGVVYQSDEDDLKNHNIREFKNLNKNICIIDDKSINIYYTFFNKYLHYIILLHNLIISYNTKDIIKKNKNIFDFYNLYKKE